jgi:FkbM family methyltransferase
MNYSTYFTEGVPEFVMTQFPPDFLGVCIDVGANDPFWLSNSWIFEQKGWDTYCIEPNPNCLPKLRKFRKKVIPFACSDSSPDAKMDFYIYETQWAGPNVDNKDVWEGEAADTGLIKHENTKGIIKSVVPVTVRTLDYILGWDGLPIDHIDYISIDVEKNEMAVLRGLDLTKWKPTIIVIENEFKTVDQHAWLCSYGYKCIKRIGVNDIYRLFF